MRTDFKYVTVPQSKYNKDDQEVDTPFEHRVIDWPYVSALEIYIAANYVGLPVYPPESIHIFKCCLLGDTKILTKCGRTVYGSWETEGYLDLDPVDTSKVTCDECTLLHMVDLANE